MDYNVAANQPSNELKYFCKVCNKGFACGRALGGHMRSHGIGGDERNGIVFDDEEDDDDDPTAEDDWDEDKMGIDYNVPPENRRMYALRTNPNRMKSCRVCENCGEEFLSWKLFLEHGKCTSDRVESLVAQASDGEEDAERRSGVGWSKRKRSFRVKVEECSTNCLSSEEEDLANCLMMLSNATATSSKRSPDEPEESCASASREDHERRNTSNYLPLITYETHFDRAKGVGRGLFECKACKKVFTSHQALGGHRASHKKVKGCFASRFDQDHDQNVNQNATQVVDHDQDFVPREDFLMPQAKSKSTLQFEHKLRTQLMLSKKKPKVHECSICHRVFSSGQALGGHKRCHWITSNATNDTSSSLGKFPQFHHDHQTEHTTSQIPTLATSEQLDLNNLPITAINEFGKVSRDPQNPLSFEVSTEIVLYDKNEHHLQPDSHDNNANNAIIIQDDDDDDDDALTRKAGDDLEPKAELPKLGELKDMSRDSSPWLQVGIGSTSIDLGGHT